MSSQPKWTDESVMQSDRDCNSKKGQTCTSAAMQRDDCRRARASQHMHRHAAICLDLVKHSMQASTKGACAHLFDIDGGAKAQSQVYGIAGPCIDGDGVTGVQSTRGEDHSRMVG